MKEAPTILATENHPFFPLVKEQVTSEIPTTEGLVIDLTLTSPRQKKQTLQRLEGCTVISDLTCYRGEEWLKLYPYIKGALGAAFSSPRQSCEVWVENETIGNIVENFLLGLGFNGVRVASPGIGFIYPRVVAMIINEAWWSLEDNLADRDNIDLAMKNGVNYPWGPFEWGEKIGLDKVKTLLNELYLAHGNERYRPCSLLREEL